MKDVTLKQLIDGIGHLTALLSVILSFLLLLSQHRWLPFRPYDEIASWSLLVSMICLAIGSKSKGSCLLYLLSAISLIVVNGYLSIVIIEPAFRFFGSSFDRYSWGGYGNEMLAFWTLPLIVATSFRLEVKANKWNSKRCQHALFASIVWLPTAVAVEWFNHRRSLYGVFWRVVLLVWFGYYLYLIAASVLFLGNKKFRSMASSPKSTEEPLRHCH